MDLRDRDAVDYLGIGVVTLLVYLHLPWRPAIRRFLRDVTTTLLTAGEFLVRVVIGQPLWVYVIAGVLVGLGILVAMVELPNRTHA